jgi:catechol 2,3-dioxygenase-like lactoylglutathione lyase family enzyme
MFHATAMGPSYDAILDPLARLFGCRVLHDNEIPDPGIERRGGMTWIADNSIEIGQPLGETSVVQKFVDRFGGGMHSVAVQVDDLDAALARAEQFGVRVASRIDWGLAWTSPRDTSGLLIEWFSKRQDDDPRWGAPEPAFAVEPIVRPRHVAYVAAMVADPTETAAHLGDVLDTETRMFDAGGATDAVAAAVNLGDCMLALYPLPTSAADSQRVWGAVHDRPRCLALALTVDDLAVAAGALLDAGVGLHHHTSDGSLLLHAGELPFPVILTDHLLPGDPRSR